MTTLSPAKYSHYLRPSPSASDDLDISNVNAYPSSLFDKISLPPYNSDFTSRPQRLNFKFWLRSRPSRLSFFNGRLFKNRSLYHVSLWDKTSVWKYLRVAFISILLIWSIYCTIRYFMSLTVYEHDPIRTHIAISLGTVSSLAALFFGLETSMVYALAMHLYIDTKFRKYTHLLTYFASLLTVVSAIVNIIVIIEWRRPTSFEDFDRAIQGRCNWDVDAVWTGTGMECVSGHGASSFGEWMGAGIVRLSVELGAVCLYFFFAKHFPGPGEEPTPFPMEAGSQMDELITNTDGFHPSIVEDSKQRFVYRPDAFRDAAQIIYGSDSDSYDSLEEDMSDSADVDTQSHYVRVLSHEPDHLPLSSSLSSLQRRLSLERSNSTGSSLLGPRPKPSSLGTKSKSSISRSNTFNRQHRHYQ